MIKIRSSFLFWQPLFGFENEYEISILGLRSKRRICKRPKGKYLIREKILKPVKSKIGYLVYGLTKGKKEVKVYRHRLIASSFIFNSNVQKRFVNHKDGNKLNNNISNLEWCTQQENNLHAYKIGLRNGDHKRKKVL